MSAARTMSALCVNKFSPQKHRGKIFVSKIFGLFKSHDTFHCGMTFDLAYLTRWRRLSEGGASRRPSLPLVLIKSAYFNAVAFFSSYVNIRCDKKISKEYDCNGTDERKRECPTKQTGGRGRIGQRTTSASLILHLRWSAQSISHLLCPLSFPAQGNASRTQGACRKSKRKMLTE